MLKPFIILSISLSLISLNTSPNRASIQIKKENLIDIKSNDTSHLTNQIIPIYELKDANDLNGFFSYKPVYVKLKINENIEVLDTFNNNLGDLSEFYTTYLEGKYIPLIEINNDDTALNYIEYINNFYIKDAAIYSSDLRTFKAFSENNSLNKNYFIYDVSNYSLNDFNNIDTLINVSNIYGVNIFTIDSMNENLKEITNYFHSFNKVVFTKNNTENIEFFSSITSGSNGIITSNLDKLNESLNKFSYDGSTTMKQIVAHRGVVLDGINENSLTSINKAIELNIPFVEIDLQITKDNEIVICHNDELKVTTDCNDNSKISQKTLKQIKEYNLIDNNGLNNEKIPTLKEVFELSKDTNLRFILEFKFDGGFSTFNLDVAKYVDEIVKKYNMESRVLGITFFKVYYESINTHMSYTPTMYLGAPNGESEFGSYNDFTKAINFFNKYNTCLDLGFDSGLKNQYFNYVSRGFLLNSYTFTDNSFISEPLNFATSDASNQNIELIKEISSESKFYTINSYRELNSKIDFKLVKYNEEVINENFSYQTIILDGDMNSPYLIVSGYYFDEINNYGVYSDAILVSNLEKGGENINPYSYRNGELTPSFNLDNYLEELTSLTKSTDLNLILLSTLIPLGVICIGSIIFLLIYRKKKIHKN